MQISINRLVPRALAMLISCAMLSSASAADKTWSGAGADSFWNNGVNWGGAQPVNNDNLIFSGFTRPNNTNNIAGLSIGWLRFANDGFTLNGNSMVMNPTTAGIITNLAGTNTIANDLTITPVGKYWYIATNTEVRLAGAITNTAAAGGSIGWLCLTNGGAVRIMNSAKSTRGMDLWQGRVIVDGGLVDATSDGLCLKPPTGSAFYLQVTNNGTVRIGGGGNFRIGNSRTGIGSPAGPGSLSQIDLYSGMIEVYGANTVIFCGDNVAGATGVFNQYGGLVWGSAGSGNTLTLGNIANADGTYNLNGGTLWIAQVRMGNAGATNATFNFNGGTLKPTASSATFFQGILNANVKNGGAIIDTTNFNITIAQNLQASGTGGLTKLGAGTLTLNGANTYTGLTVVSNGALVTTSSSYQGGGAITVSGTGNLLIPFNGAPLNASALNLGSSVTNSLTIDLGAFPSPGSSPALSVTSLNGTGTGLINITGSSFASGTYPLITFVNSSGLGSIKLGSLPLGVSGTLQQVGNTLSLNIALVPKNLAWSGAINGDWNTSTFNWVDLNNASTPTNFFQSGGSGDAVTFDDTVGSGATAINIPSTVTPSQIVVNNNLNYSFTGAGKISGGTSLTKGASGFGFLTIAMANDYSGGTVINAGNVYIASNQALGSGDVTMNSGTLASDGATARGIANNVVQNANTGVTLGDLANNGTLTLSGRLDLGGGNARTLTLNSDVIVTGALTNGGFTTRTGPGTLVVKGGSQQNALVTQQEGDVIIDGARFDSLDGWRVDNIGFVQTVRLAITNGGIFTILSTTGNLRVGLAGGDAFTDNILDVSGTINLFPTLGLAGNSSVILGASGANCVMNLRPGGLLACRSIIGNSPANTEIHFSGGTIKPLADEPSFFQGITNALIENGGLVVDTTNFNISIAQPLVAAGSGGLQKIGAGSLTLSGANTYSGSTLVDAGKLILGVAHAAAGGINVASNATLAFLASSPGVTVRIPSATGSDGAALEAQLSGLSANPTAPAGFVTNLVLNGTLKANLLGANIKIGQFPLFGYGSISGSGGIVVGQLPQGVVASLATNTSAKTIDLVVTSVTPLLWKGSVNGNWDTTTTNWSVAGIPTAYSQGDNVRFDDSAANGAVNLTMALSPGGVAISNNAVSYQFSGAGSLGGPMSLSKEGTNRLALGTANSFSGTVTVKAGTLVTGNAAALGLTTGATAIQPGATLDVAAQNLGLEPVVVGGSGVDGSGAIINTGADQNDALKDVTLTGDTVINATGSIGIRTTADTDPGLRGNGFKLTKRGPGAININGGTTNPGDFIWDTDLGNIDIVEGSISFERRITLGRSAGKITVAPGTALRFYALSPSVPLQTKAVELNNANIIGNGTVAADGSMYGGPITLVGTSNAIYSLTGTTLRLLGPMIGTGGFVKNMGPITTLSLEGTNTYNGPTVVNMGTVALASSATLTGTSPIEVDAGAFFDVTPFFPWTLSSNQTLTGDGTVSGSVLANGTIAPGLPIGTLTINGDLTLAGTNIMELSKDAGITNDALMVNGTLTFGGKLIVNVVGTTPLAVNDSFKLFNFLNTPTGSFTLTLPSAYTWDVTQLASDGTIKVTGVSNPPHIASAAVIGGSLTITGTGGQSAAAYYVVSSANVDTPLSNWTRVATNTFASNGSFTNSLPINTLESRRFFVIQLP